VNQVDFLLFISLTHFLMFLYLFSQSPNLEAMERTVSNINAFGVNRPTQPSKQERGLCLVIANEEKRLEVL
jgi:hypothetical protein